MAKDHVFDDLDGEDEPEVGTESVWTSPLGIEKHSFYDGDGSWTGVWKEPDWDYVYDEDGHTVPCPSCGEDLRFNGQPCCPSCDSTFSEDEVTELAGRWHV